MKCRVIPMVLLTLVIIFISPIIKAEDFSEYTLMAENEYLKLYMDKETTRFAVLDKKSGETWYSNPENIAVKEKIARGRGKEQLYSQFSINYYAPGDKPMFMDNYNDSVKYGQFTIRSIDQGVRVEYILGKQWKDEDNVPVVINKSRFEELILNKITDPSDRDFVKSMYILVQLEKRRADEKEVQVYKVKKDLFKEYVLRSLQDEKNQSKKDEFDLDMLFSSAPSKLGEKELIELLIDQIVEHRKDLSDRDEVNFNDLNHLIDNPVYILRKGISKWDFNDLLQLIKTTGYKVEDLIKDHLENKIDPPKENRIVFKIPLEYRLKGEKLVVTIPFSEVYYPKDIINEEGEKVTYPLHYIEVLNYFGCADMTDKGYIFVPDGSGALIYLNNGKTHVKAYEQGLYGFDYSIAVKSEMINSAGEQSYLPIYGLKKDSKAFMAIIEKGSSFANIIADVAGKSNSFNTVFPRLIVMPKSIVELKPVNPDEELPNVINIYQKEIYQDDVIISYQFLHGDNADYVGMAKKYQNYLITKGLRRVIPEADIPFYLELIGAHDKKEVILGAPRTVIKPMTTFKEAKDIIKEMLAADIKNVKLRYTGAFKGGIWHYYPNKFELEKALGSKNDFDVLRDYLSENGVDLYLDVSLINVYRDRLFDGFNISDDSSRYLNRKPAKIYEYNIATYLLNPEKYSYILAPEKLKELTGKAIKRYSNDDLDGISLREIGRQLNSDFDEKNLFNREKALELISENVQSLYNHSFEIMINGGNSYLLPYVSDILNFPAKSSEFNIIDKTVPFYQIVLHGFIPYAYEPFNLVQNSKINLLKCLETGAYPYYLWTYKDTSILKNTDYNYLYSTTYKDWFKEAINLYKEVNEILRDLQDKKIIDHQKREVGVYETVYENGVTIIINYNDYDVEINGEKIPAKNYKVYKEGKRR